MSATLHISLSKNTPSNAFTYLCSKLNDDQTKNSTGISVDRILPVGRLKHRVHVGDQFQVGRYISKKKRLIVDLSTP